MHGLRATVAAAALLGMSMAPASAVTIGNLGVNPTSAQGNFESASAAGGSFTEEVLFALAGGPLHLTIASVVNTFAAASDFIANFSASVWSYGDDGLLLTADDIEVIGPVPAGPCQVPNCQGMAGSAILDVGSYYAQFTGIGGATAGYAGNISTSEVPIPAALPLFGGVLAAWGGVTAWKRRRAAA